MTHYKRPAAPAKCLQLSNYDMHVCHKMMANLYINVALNSLQYYSNYFIEIECLVEKHDKNKSDVFL